MLNARRSNPSRTCFSAAVVCSGPRGLPSFSCLLVWLYIQRMWSSVQCGPDPFKASLQVIHQQHALAEQSRLPVSTVGRVPLSTASSHPLLYSRQSSRPQPSQQYASIPHWSDEYLRTQSPSHAAPLALQPAPASKWLNEYSSFHSRIVLSTNPSVAPLSVDEYERSLAHQHPSRSPTPPHASVPSVVRPILYSLSQPAIGVIPRPSLPLPTVTLTALHRPPTATTAPIPYHSAHPAIHNFYTSPIANSTPSTAAASPFAAPLASTTAAVKASTLTHSTSLPSTLASSVHTHTAVEAARLHDALYGDEHELSDADFIHDGQWQHFTTPPQPTNQPQSPLAAHLGVSTHVIQQMTATTAQPPQQRYTTDPQIAAQKRLWEDRRDAAAAVDVGVLEFGSEWDASGRVWDWVVQERQLEAANEAHTNTATALGGDVDDMDAMLKEFYL